MATTRYICTELEEMEREEVFRLKRVKQRKEREKALGNLKEEDEDPEKTALSKENKDKLNSRGGGGGAGAAPLMTVATNDEEPKTEDTMTKDSPDEVEDARTKSEPYEGDDVKVMQQMITNEDETNAQLNVLEGNEVQPAPKKDDPTKVGLPMNLPTLPPDMLRELNTNELQNDKMTSDLTDEIIDSEQKTKTSKEDESESELGLSEEESETIETTETNATDEISMDIDSQRLSTEEHMAQLENELATLGRELSAMEKNKSLLELSQLGIENIVDVDKDKDKKPGGPSTSTDPNSGEAGTSENKPDEPKKDDTDKGPDGKSGGGNDMVVLQAEAVLPYVMLTLDTMNELDCLFDDNWDYANALEIKPSNKRDLNKTLRFSQIAELVKDKDKKDIKTKSKTIDVKTASTTKCTGSDDKDSSNKVIVIDNKKTGTESPNAIIVSAECALAEVKDLMIKIKADKENQPPISSRKTKIVPKNNSTSDCTPKINLVIKGDVNKDEGKEKEMMAVSLSRSNTPSEKSVMELVNSINNMKPVNSAKKSLNSGKELHKKVKTTRSEIIKTYLKVVKTKLISKVNKCKVDKESKKLDDNFDNDLERTYSDNNTYDSPVRSSYSLPKIRSTEEVDEIIPEEEITVTKEYKTVKFTNTDRKTKHDSNINGPGMKSNAGNDVTPSNVVLIKSYKHQDKQELSNNLTKPLSLDNGMLIKRSSERNALMSHISLMPKICENDDASQSNDDTNSIHGDNNATGNSNLNSSGNNFNSSERPTVDNEDYLTDVNDFTFADLDAEEVIEYDNDLINNYLKSPKNQSDHPNGIQDDISVVSQDLVLKPLTIKSSTNVKSDDKINETKVNKDALDRKSCSVETDFPSQCTLKDVSETDRKILKDANNNTDISMMETDKDSSDHDMKAHVLKEKITKIYKDINNTVDKNTAVTLKDDILNMSRVIQCDDFPEDLTFQLEDDNSISSDEI